MAESQDVLSMAVEAEHWGLKVKRVGRVMLLFSSGMVLFSPGQDYFENRIPYSSRSPPTGGARFGVAKRSNLIAVKVLGSNMLVDFLAIATSLTFGIVKGQSLECEPKAYSC